MPLYEYLCGSCGHRFERIQKFADAALTECPSCGGAVEKQPSSPAIQFKGSGWYITDYAKPGAKDSNTKDSKGDPATSAGAPAEKSTPAATPASSGSSNESSSSSARPTAPAPAPAKSDAR